MDNPLDFFSSLNFSGMFFSVINVVMIVIIAVIVGLFVFMYFRWKKNKRAGVDQEIYWWEEIQGYMRLIRKDKAQEIIIPGTNLRLFYIKDKNMWLPRFANAVKQGVFFVTITKNKEIINWTPKSIDKELAKTNLSFDNTDMRWAAENLREFVKRNYKDKAEKWWKEYAGVISLAIFIVLMTISLVTIIYFMRGIVQDMGAIGSSLASAIDKINACSPGSGIVT